MLDQLVVERAGAGVEATQPLRLLIVDDYPDAVEATCLLFARFGHLCHSATTGARALEEADAFHPDIAVLDLGLPDLSGFDVARELRRRYGAAMYLAALTGWCDPDGYRRSYAAGFDQHIVKPASALVLCDLIVTAERSRGWSAMSRAWP